MLGVTTNELLSGKREETGNPKAEIIIQNTLQYAQSVAKSKNKNTRSFVELVLAALFTIAIIVCAICDLAISQSLTWSLYPIASIIFTWLVVMPLFLFKTNKIAASLIALSVFVIPFLFCIEQISRTTWFFSLGVPCSIASIAYLWCVFVLLKKIKNKLYAAGFSLIITIPLTLIINLIESYFDVWDAMSIGIIMIVAIVLFLTGYFRNKKAD